MAKEYVMPRPTDIVRWQHVPGSEFNPAVVTQRGRSAISIMVFPPESRFGTPKSGVLHVSDPRAKTLVSVGDGLWDYTEEHLNFLGVMDRVSAMLGKMEAMKDRSQWMEAHVVQTTVMDARLADLRTDLETMISTQSESFDAYINQVLNGLKDGFKTRFSDIEGRIKQLEDAFLNR